MPRKLPSPPIPGLVATPTTVGQWCGNTARSWQYFNPADCRPLSKRIAVFLREDGNESRVRIIEGDGRNSDFKVHASRELPTGATEEDALAVVTEFVSFMLAAPSQPHTEQDRLAAGILASAGFELDDFWGQEAWLMPSDYDNYTFYVRGAPAPEFVQAGGRTIAVPLTEDIHPEMPVEVGIAYDLGSDRTYCIAPCLEEAIRIVDEGKLSLPDNGGEAVAVEYESLLRKTPNARPGIR